METQGRRILIVEDETKVAQAVREGLEAEGLQPVVAGTCAEAIGLVQQQPFDVMLLDLNLPDGDGLNLLQSLRRQGMETSVLVLTARDTIAHRVEGLDRGADDYLVKPFAFPELLARLRALLRRARVQPVLVLRCRDLEMDLVTRVVIRHEKCLDLTPREFDLLAYLLRHQGHAVSRQMLAQDVWREPMRATPIDNVIDVHIARLRRKLDAPFSAPLLHTVRGVGFMLGSRAR